MVQWFKWFNGLTLVAELGNYQSRTRGVVYEEGSKM